MRALPVPALAEPGTARVREARLRAKAPRRARDGGGIDGRDGTDVARRARAGAGGRRQASLAAPRAPGGHGAPPPVVEDASQKLPGAHVHAAGCTAPPAQKLPAGQESPPGEPTQRRSRRRARTPARLERAGPGRAQEQSHQAPEQRQRASPARSTARASGTRTSSRTGELAAGAHPGASATARDSGSRRGRRWPARARERVHHCSRVPSPRPGASTAWHTRPDPLCLPLDVRGHRPVATRRRQPWRALFLMLRCGACGPSSGMNRSRR